MRFWYDCEDHNTADARSMPLAWMPWPTTCAALPRKKPSGRISQALVSRYALVSRDRDRCARGEESLLQRSEMLEFVDASRHSGQCRRTGKSEAAGWLSAAARGKSTARAIWIGSAARASSFLACRDAARSLCARAIAGDWKLPLVKFDTAAVYDKYIGETEKRIQKVFQVAEGLAPCVLWIDELEKVFAGSGPDSASVDAGVSSRLLAVLSFLDAGSQSSGICGRDLQQRDRPAARVDSQRPLRRTLFRRFAEPGRAEANLRHPADKRKRNPADFDLDQVAAAAKGFSGAEIDAAVQTALYAAYSRKRSSPPRLAGEQSVHAPLSTTS